MRDRGIVRWLAPALAAVTMAACSSAGSHATPTTTATTAASQQPAAGSSSGDSPVSSAPSSSFGVGTAVSQSAGHVVIVMMENHSYADIIGNSSAPYLNSLAQHGMSLTDMHAVTHPSQPNYLALFSGSTQGVTSDSCPQSFAADNLGHQLRSTGLGWSFAGYSEGLPTVGSTACSAGTYARKHAPWADFTDLPAWVNQPFTQFPSNYATLPTVSFVIPNLDHDMHDGTIAEGDAWVHEHLGGYASWAATHDSLLVITWDEDDFSQANHIATIITGAHVPHQQVTHALSTYSLLRFVEERYGLKLLGASATASPIPPIAP